MILVGDWASGRKQVELSYAATLTLANLEGPVLPSVHSLAAGPKAGPHLYSWELPKESGQFIFSLANNHIMDYGALGLEASLTELKKKNFTPCGAGRNIIESRQPIVVRENGVTIGIIACCEAQFGVARNNSAGVAEFGPWVHRTIQNLLKSANKVIVSVHAGVEDSPWPSPYIRDLYRSYIDAGASVVHGHHAHIPQGYERYGEGVIFYGMGNFAVDPDKWQNYPNSLWSLAAEIDFGSHPLRWQPITFEIRPQKDSNIILIEKSSFQEQESHQCHIEKCNRPLSDELLFEALWQEVALRAYHHYGAEYVGFSASSKCRVTALARKLLAKIKNRLLGKPSTMQSDQYGLMLKHVMVACESHRQMLSTALGILSGEIRDARTDESRRLADEMMPWSREAVQA